ncbi:MAG: hypothetical protein KAJ29_06655 [Alphaproteobacteria bacterium]|nr:hypothetical protein [Alphaproteobacteria bacterium]
MKRILIIIGTIVLAGCTSIGQDGDPLPKITFDHVKPYPLYVAAYEPVGLPVSMAPNRPAGFVTDPDQIIFDYLNSRFEAVGTQGKLVVKIRSVDIAHESIDSENSFNALIGLNKKDYYRVTAIIDINVLGIGNIDWQKQSMTVYRDIYISEHVSLVEREKLELQAMDHMVDDLDIALRKILNDNLGILRPHDNISNDYTL